jgi:hypothetical protein
VITCFTVSLDAVEVFKICIYHTWIIQGRFIVKILWRYMYPVLGICHPFSKSIWWSFIIYMYIYIYICIYIYIYMYICMYNIYIILIFNHYKIHCSRIILLKITKPKSLNSKKSLTCISYIDHVNRKFLAVAAWI